MIPIYWGIFVPNCGGTLDKVVKFQHVTFGFGTEYPKVVYGKLADIKIVGYGNDGQNEAYLVEIPDWTADYYTGAPKKHITLSTAYGAKPVDSYKLKFTSIEPFTLWGMFGYFDKLGIHLE